MCPVSQNGSYIQANIGTQTILKTGIEEIGIQTNKQAQKDAQKCDRQIERWQANR